MYNKVVRRIRFTRKGYEKLKKEYENLLKERPAAVLDLKKAREMGDLSENGYYKASRAKLSEIDRNTRKILLNLKRALVVDDSKRDYAGIGSTIRLSDGRKEMIYYIVGDLEADPDLGKISLLSPIGRAIENKKAGDAIKVYTPSGKINYKILAIS